MATYYFLSGGGETGKLIRAIDWSKTSLGNPGQWPQSLRTAVSICLNSPNPILLYCGSDYVRIYNDAYSKLIGTKHPFGLGKKEGGMWPELWAKLRPKLEKVLQTGAAALHENQALVLDRNGYEEECYFTYSYSPICDEQSGISGIFSIVNETTQTVLREKQLTKLLTNLFVQAPLAICIMRGKDFIIDFANEMMLTLWGKSAEAVINKSRFEVLPDTDGAYERLLTKVYQTGERFVANELPVKVVRNEKTEDIFVKFVCEPLRDENGTVSSIMILADDVTEQVAARQKVQEMSARFETMANNLPHLAWIANADGWIFWYNERWYEYTGTTPKDMEGWGWQSVHNPDTLPAVLEEWQRSISTGQPFDMVFPLKSADNVFHPFLTRVIPVRNSNGDITQWLGTNTDITKQKELEQLKDDFLSIASHELKTPVTALKISLHLAEEAAKRETSFDRFFSFVAKANKQVDKLTSLIEELLDITKIQTGNLHLSISRFSLSAAVNEWVETAKTLTSRHRIVLESADEIILEGDKIRLEQVVMNFLSNAIKYSPAADTIIVTLSKEGADAKLMVTDFGFGISSDMLPFVFDRFFRTKRTQNFSGLGLGLYITSEIIKQHQGIVGVTSKVNHGSSFWFAIPSAQYKFSI